MGFQAFLLDILALKRGTRFVNAPCKYKRLTKDSVQEDSLSRLQAKLKIEFNAFALHFCLLHSKYPSLECVCWSFAKSFLVNFAVHLTFYTVFFFMSFS